MSDWNFENDPRFNYEPYERNVFLTYDELNDISAIIRDPNSNIIKIVINTIRITALFLVAAIRKKMFDEELRLKRQLFVRRSQARTRIEIKDNLDG